MLIAGTAAATILTRESVPPAGLSVSDAAFLTPVSNREAKTDKLLLAAADDENTGSEADAKAAEDAGSARNEATEARADDPAPMATRPVQLAYAAPDDAGFAIPMPEPRAKVAEPATKLPPVIATAPVQKPRPAKPKPPALLSEAQISQIKGRLNLSSSQEYYWPSVEQALRAIGRKLHAARYVADSGPPPIDPDSAEVQQLKYAAMPLLFQMREDQKQEVRKLARSMGLEQVAQSI